MNQQATRVPKGTWVTFRPDIKIHDCTIRDGGLINDHMFEDGFVKVVYETLAAAGVDYMELGYKSSKQIFSPEKYGKWKFCTEDDLRRIVGDNPTELKLSVMADAERTDLSHRHPGQGAERDRLRARGDVHSTRSPRPST